MDDGRNSTSYSIHRIIKRKIKQVEESSWNEQCKEIED